MIGKRALENSKKVVGVHHDYITIVKVLDERDKRKAQMYLCRCDCGKEFKKPSDGLFNIKSCGCMRKKIVGNKNTKHGGSATRLYVIWSCMKERCYNANMPSYCDYGGRGIGVCPEWKNSFAAFRKWAEETDYNEKAKTGECTLDRIDFNGNYEPNNCRWTNMKEQQNNRRDNRRITFKNETHTLSEWADIVGINYKALHRRLKQGWTIERAFTEPQKHIVYLEYKGTKKRLTQWAKEMGVNRHKLSYLKEHGWSDKEIIERMIKNGNLEASNQ